MAETTPTTTAPSAAPAAAPDLSSMNQPGAAMTPAPAATVAPDNAAAAVQAQVAPYVENEKQAIQNMNDLSKPTPPPAPVPHARLLAMVSGLATGLSAAAMSLSTHGREGGAAEVTRIQGEEAAQKQRAAEFATTQKNAKIQQQITVADTNHKMAQNIILLATLPDEIAKSHLSVTGAQQTQAITGADFQATHGGMAPEDFMAAMSNKAPIQGQQGANPFFMNGAQSTLRAAKTAGLPDDNPAVKNLQSVLASPNVNAKDLYLATTQLQQEQQRQGMAAEQLAKAEAVAPLGSKAIALNAAAQDWYQVLNPGKPLPPEYKLSPDSTQQDYKRIDALMEKTGTAQSTKANRDIVNGMRQEMLNLAKGVEIPGDSTKDGADYISSLPVGLAGTIKAIHEGRELPPPTGSRSPAAQSLLGALNHAYPDYDASKAPSYFDMRKKFADGDIGKGLNAINTVETHLSRMYNHANAPATSGGLTGKVTGFFGDKDVRALDIDATAVATELGKAYNAGAITEGEKNDWESKLDFTKPGMTSGKLVTNIREIDELLEGKQKAFQSQWAAGVPAPGIVTPFPIISSDAAAARATIRGEAPPASAASTASAYPRPATVSANAKLMQVPGGQPHWIEPQNQAAAVNAGAKEVQ